jgi:enediyne biosynthesis protein E4
MVWETPLVAVAFAASPHRLSRCVVLADAAVSGKCRFNFCVTAGLLIVLTACAPRDAFVDIAAQSGIVHSTISGTAKTHIRESLGHGLCWIDHDRDGDPDLLVLNGGTAVLPSYDEAQDKLLPWRFYENQRGRFREVSGHVGLAQRGWALGCAVADADGDGFDDLFITTVVGGNRLFRNRGGRGFEDRTAESGLGGAQYSTSAAFADLDGDGDLDLFVARYLDETRPPEREGCLWKGAPVMCGPKGYPPLDALLYRNDGNGVFQDVSAAAGIAGHPGFGLGVVIGDFDEDGDPDIYVANDSSPSHLFVNKGGLSFEEGGLAAGLALSQHGGAQAGMGVDSGDLDGDGRSDIVKTNFSDDINNFYRNDGHGVFSEWAYRSGLAAASLRKLGWAVLIEDFDLDGSSDLLVVNGHVYPEIEMVDRGTDYRQQMQFFRNVGEGRFCEADVGGAFRRRILGRAAAAADFDGDGDMDVAVTRDGEPPLLLQNNMPKRGVRLLKVRLRGRSGNPDGIGAVVTAACGGRRQSREVRRARGYLGSSEPVAVFGCNANSPSWSIEVRWRSGERQLVEPAASIREVWVEELEHLQSAGRATGVTRIQER